MTLDLELVGGTRLQDKERADEEFSAFFARAYEQTLGVVVLATGERNLAEDATQEAFARCLDDWRSVKAKDRPDRWVARVALNLAIDHLRKVARETSLDTAHHAPRADHVEELWVRWNLDQLTPMQRAAVVRRYVEGRSVEEVASALGRSRDTVKTHLRLARGRLRKSLSADRG